MSKSNYRIQGPSLGEEDLELMTLNLLQLQHEITEKSEHSQHLLSEQLTEQHTTDQKGHFENNYSTKRNYISAIRQSYETYLSTHQLPQIHEQKIQQLVSENMSIGNAVALFQMLYYFRQALDLDILAEISEKSFQALMSSSEYQELRVYGELIAECSIENQQVCRFMAQGLIEERIQIDLAILVLTNQKYMGLIYLFDIANRDIPNISHKILDYLSRTQEIISAIIIPLLIEDALCNYHPKYRQIALTALNRLGPLINETHFEKLLSLMDDSSIDKKILLATIRSTGLEGEKLIIQMITSKCYSQPIVTIALSVLSWRVPSHHVLRIKAIQYTLENCFLPGRLYQYEGSIQPWDYQSSSCSDSLCLNSRDFLTRIQPLVKEGTHKFTTRVNNRSIFSLVEVLDLEAQQESIQISEQVIKTLSNQLKNKSNQIRQIALLELGNIGKPDATMVVQTVAKCLWDGDSTIKSATCWTISRICQNPSKKIQNRLNQLLKDHFWKVRTSACIALGLIIKSPQISTIQGLIKVLQDGSISKATICQTLVRMGAQQLLLQILKGSSSNDFKLRQAIIASFQYSSLKSPLLNSIVQQLLRYSRDSRIQTRQLCLVTINSLRKKVEELGTQTISYFQTKNLLPFYYCFLQDHSAKIRAIASENILSFGSQAELIFIEGMTKGQSLAKIECIRSLGKLGVQNFRAVILGLRDEDQRVRRIASETILNYYSSEQIVEEFGCRENHSISLLCNLKQILNSAIKSNQLRKLIKQVISQLQNRRKHGNTIKYYNQNVRLN